MGLRSAAGIALLLAGCTGQGGDGPPRGSTGGTAGTGGAAGAGAAAGTGGTGAVDPGPPPTAQWVRRFGASGSDQAFGVARTPQGAIVVTGQFSDSVDFGTGAKQSNGSTDAFVLGLGADGSISWAQTFGGTAFDAVDGAVVDSQGNIFIGGSISASVDLGAGPSPFAGDHDALVAKLGPGGVPLWLRVFGGGGFDVAGRLAVDGSDNVIVGGSFEQSVDFGGGVRTAQGDSDGFVVKLDSQGNYVWDATFGGATAHQEFARSVAVDATGDVYAVGMSAPSTGNIGFSVRRLDAATGSTVWSRPVGQDLGSNRAETVTLLSDRVVVGGYVHHTIALGSTTIESSDDDPVLVAFMRSDGAPDWSRQWHAPGNDHVYGIGTFNDEIVFTGRIDENLDLDGVQATHGCQDAYLARVSADGSPRGAATFGGSACGDLGRTVVAYDATRVLLVGEVSGNVTVFGKATSGGDDDAFVALLAMP